MPVLTLYKHSKAKILAHGTVVRFYTTVLTLGREKKVFWRTFFEKKVEGAQSLNNIIYEELKRYVDIVSID